MTSKRSHNHRMEMSSPGAWSDRRTIRGVVLVGHGGIPTDFPREHVSRLKALESRRRANGHPPTTEELELELSLRTWPRTPETDPYKAGLEALAEHVRAVLQDRHVVVAYNEFCAPTIEEATDALVVSGASDVILIPSMLTPGGSHSEVEIPSIVNDLQTMYPAVSIRYAWPFDLSRVARLLADQLTKFGD